MDWPRAVLHMGVSEVDSASLGWDSYTAERAEGLCQGKTRAHREGSRTVEEYTCGITRRGITTHGHLAQHKGWPWEPARRPGELQPGPQRRTSGARGVTDVPAVGQQSGAQGPGSLSRNEVWVWGATLTWLHGWAGGAGEGIASSDRTLLPTGEGRGGWECEHGVSCTAILALLGTALFLRFWEQNKKETKDSPPGPPPGKEWCGHHLLKSRIQRLRVDRLRDAACPGASRAWQGRRQAAPLSSESEVSVEVSVPRSWRKQLQRVLPNPETRHWTCQVKAEIKAVPVSNSTVRSICKAQDCSLRSASADAGPEPWGMRAWAPSLWKITRRVRSVCKGSTSQCSQQALPSTDRACSSPKQATQRTTVSLPVK